MKISKWSTVKQTLPCGKPEVRVENGGGVRSDKINIFGLQYQAKIHGSEP